MGTVFLSYSSRDKAKAVELFNRLCAEGYSCWIDESGISPATQWSSEIAKAIDECVVFIILLSQNALDSENVIKELSLASEGKKHIIPVNLEFVELSHEVKYQLTGLQRVAYEDYDRIEKAIRNIIGDTVPASDITGVTRKSLTFPFANKFDSSLKKNLPFSSLRSPFSHPLIFFFSGKGKLLQ